MSENTNVWTTHKKVFVTVDIWFWDGELSPCSHLLVGSGLAPPPIPGFWKRRMWYWPREGKGGSPSLSTLCTSFFQKIPQIGFESADPRSNTILSPLLILPWLLISISLSMTQIVELLRRNGISRIVEPQITNYDYTNAYLLLLHIIRIRSRSGRENILLIYISW